LGYVTEVETFKKTYGVLFPVLLDTDYKAHDAVGEPRVPFLIIAKRDGRGKWIVVSTKVGLMGTSEKRTATYLVGDLIVETMEGDIFSIEQFVDELRTLLNTPAEKLKFKKPSE
jgi:hypothetical protein